MFMTGGHLMQNKGNSGSSQKDLSVLLSFLLSDHL